MNKPGDVARRSGTTVVREPPAGYGPGRPPVHDEDWTKVTVVLLNRQIVHLDLLAADIRATTGAAIKRAEILRALVDALAASGIDLTSATCEADLRAILSSRLQHDTAVTAVIPESENAHAE